MSLLRMEKERNYMTEILNLTLEIIYLLTGEHYMVVKKTAGDKVTLNSHRCVLRSWSKIQNLINDRPPPSPTLERNEKILEVIQKITKLLTREVPIRCQDVTVYFSMEEWEYLEGHKDLYKDIMMENRTPLTSPSGSSNRNTPDRCPRPLYSQDSTQKHHVIPQEDQVGDVKGKMLFNIKAEVKEEADDLYMMGDDPYKEEIPPESNTDVSFTQDGQYRSYQTEEPEKDDLISDTASKESFTPSVRPVLPGGDPSSNYPVVSGGDPPSDSSTWMGFFLDLPPSVPHQTIHMQVQPFPSSHLGECFTSGDGLIPPLRDHTTERPFSCSQCGKRFARKFCLITHEKIHTGLKPYSCSQCGKCFSRKSSLVTHERVHTGERPFSCAECGKQFSQRSHLIGHERTHTGVKPYSCPVCGKCYSRKADLDDHHKTHTGVKPYSCSMCGKCFNNKSNFHTHRRIHATDCAGKDRHLQRWGKIIGLLK